MKVLEGKKDWSIERTCDFCKAKLLVDEEDVALHEVCRWSDLTDSHYIDKVFGYVCPECGEVQYLPDSKIPQRVMTLVFRKDRNKQLEKGEK